ncbi:hypothetical protein GCM10007895_13340 [Paraferrimonas sedimenticola]|uniref:Uncharacterized protein n=2 Tax=Paraferrimonas sedimenticola TaxID=375674 RepID=A0AA37W0U5_9GAMM|nr:hypothetical protein GCM10007895_13340 [Paraferrimonas sedimenticola]
MGLLGVGLCEINEVRAGIPIERPNLELDWSRAAVTDVAQWQSFFDQKYPLMDPVMDITKGNESGRFAWEAPAWIRSYLALYQTTRDMQYLEKAVNLAQHMALYTDEARHRRGEIDVVEKGYWQAPKYYLNNRGNPVPGWRGYSKGWRVQVLQDGRILSAILRVVDRIKQEQVSEYLAVADELLALAERVIESHDTSFSHTKTPRVAGSYYYPHVRNRYTNDNGLFSKPLPFNHNMAMAEALLLAHKWMPEKQDYWDKAELLTQFFADHMQIREDGSCFWRYAFVPRDPNSKAEDITHADIEIGFLVIAQEMQLADVSPMLDCMAQTLVVTMYDDGEISYKVDGTGVAKGYHQMYVASHWLELAGREPRIAEIAFELLNRLESPPSSFNGFLGWAQLLALQDSQRQAFLVQNQPVTDEGPNRPD